MNKVDVKIMSTKKQYLKRSFSELLKDKNNIIMEEQLSKKKCRINLNKSIFIETSILDLSAVLMQAFRYKNKYGDKDKMLLTDTDSPTYKTEAENIHEDFYKDKESFDFINYSKDSRYYNNGNTLVIEKNEI